MNRATAIRLARRLADVFWRGLVLAIAALLGIPVFVLCVVALVLVPIGVGVLPLSLPLLGVRSLAEFERAWAAEWSGVRISRPYRPGPSERTGFWGLVNTTRWLLGDPATWRDLLWTLLNVPIGVALGAVSAALVLDGLFGALVAPWLWLFLPGHPPWLAAAFPLGCVFLALAPFAGPYLQRVHAWFSRFLLGPAPSAMAARVDELTEFRSQLVDESATELRRIERDLHDGPQARLAALGMNMALAERMIRENPEAAIALLADARESSVEALRELRLLVRGIHPPVLAERGLAPAVEALTLTLPIPVDLESDLPVRAPPPTEAAMYFAVAEALANVVKHSRGTRAEVRLRYERGRLTAVVRDDGVGGADSAAGSGIQGVRNRLAALDGSLTVSSPLDGPTVVTMEIPCELSSARTTPSSGTA